MAALSDYLESGLLHHMFRGESFPKPDTIAIALTSGVPQDSDTGSTIPEIPSGISNTLTGYKRINLNDPSTQGDNFWLYKSDDHSAGSGVIKNAVSFVFDTALQDWGWVSGIAILDSSEYGEGNLLMHSQLDNPRIIYTGDSVKFDLEALQISFR